MPENAFTNQDNTTRQFFENVEDKAKLVEEAFFDSVPIKALSDGEKSLVAPKHCSSLLADAFKALAANNIHEATHQLRRELDFCKSIPKMAGSPHEKAAQAGIAALNQNRTAREIALAMADAWNKAWLENPAPLYTKY